MDEENEEPMAVAHAEDDILHASVRARKQTEKGAAFWNENHFKSVRAAFKSIKIKSDYINILISEHAGEDAIKNAFKDWMGACDKFYSAYDKCDDTERMFSSEKLFISNFKSFVQGTVSEFERSAHSDAIKDFIVSDNMSEVSRVSRASGSSHSISSVRLKDERKRAELLVEASMLKSRQELEFSKQELELSKLKLKMREDELKLNTKLAVSSAKSLVLEKFVKEEMNQSVLGVDDLSAGRRLSSIKHEGKLNVSNDPDKIGFGNRSQHDPLPMLSDDMSKLMRDDVYSDDQVLSNQVYLAWPERDHKLRTASIGQSAHGLNTDLKLPYKDMHPNEISFQHALSHPPTTCPDSNGPGKVLIKSEPVHTKSILNPHVQTFLPNERFKGGLRADAYSAKPGTRSSNTIQVGSQSMGMGTSRPEPTTSDVISSVVKQLRKPTPEIKTFCGDPLDYRKFMRQFNTKIVANSEGNEECMSYLEQFTGGEAGKIVSGYSYLNADQGYYAALRELEERYGEQDVLANAFVKRALDWPMIKVDDAKDLDNFSIFLTECENALIEISAMKVLEYPQNMKGLVGKLPFYFHDRWRGLVQSKRSQHLPVTFSDLVMFVKNEAKKANDPTYGREALRLNAKPVISGGSRTPATSYRARSFATDVINESRNDEPVECLEEHHRTNQKTSESAFNKPCMFCKDHHSLEACICITDLSFQDRLQFLRTKGLCFGCLRPGHLRRECRSKKQCSRCPGRHPTICHIARTENEPVGGTALSVDGPSEVHVSMRTGVVGAGSSTGAGDVGGTCSTLAIVPVSIKLKNGLRVVNTYAFLDPGSSVSFCTTELMRQLSVSGKRMRITLDTMGDSQPMHTSVIEGLQVGDLQLKNVVDLPKLYSVDRMPVAQCHIPTSEDLARWPHLSDLVMPKIDGKVGLLIGNNVPDAYTPIELRTGPRGTPHATKTLMGWVPWNVMRSGDNDLANPEESLRFPVNRTEIKSIEEFDQLQQLNMQVHKFLSYDFPERVFDEKKEYSQEDKYFLQKVSDTIVLKDSHYQIALPFRSDNVQFPNNSLQALQRLNNLKRKFLRYPKFREDYLVFMKDILDKGYAERVPLEELNRDDGKVWYIPHHGVYHTKKPSKIRVVFDCAASTNGVSLNTALLSGPDLTNSLIGVLLRFRQEPVAIMGDIDSMFYQVKVERDDWDCLRFFWWPDGNLDCEPVAHRMIVHLFGSVSSPSCSNAALRQTVIDNQGQFSAKVTNSVLNDFYVDDCLLSVTTEQEAISLVRDIGSLCMKGGFHVSKWVSNRRQVLMSIPVDKLAKDVKAVDLQCDSLPSERALGVCWNVELDTLGFHVQVRDQILCRRSILSAVSSLYDPLGLVAPFILIAKILVQDLCRQDLGWDEQIAETDKTKWYQWLSDLPNLQKLALNRCYKPEGFGIVVKYELHAFSDASEVGYGTAVYLRLVNEKNQVHCCLVMGKSRVSPLKKVTIPRLELTAAMIAVRISKMVVSELGYPVQQVFFWTDSMSVLRYISNETARFNTFVANRIAVIRGMSDIQQWKYVESKCNPADIASRGMRVDKLLQSSLWFNGPGFLWKDYLEWPKQTNDLDIHLIADPEVKIVNAIVLEQSGLDQLLLRCGTWLKLKRTVGWIIRFGDNLRFLVAKRRDLIDLNSDSHRISLDQSLCRVKQSVVNEVNFKNKSPCLTSGDLEKAEKALVYFVQHQYFPEEIRRLEAKKGVGKNSPLVRLDPLLSDGLVRVGGRLKRADIHYEAKHPVVLPNKSVISRLILESIHKDVGHLGKIAMLSKLRQQYWILGANSAIKSLVSKCVTCRKYQSQRGEQKMADLPIDRTMPDNPPFSHVGMDFFGPIEVKRGRSMVKRYGVIFTCMASRAVHLEMAHSLDTSSCINTIRRFIARRGPVQLIRSDNGTNLVGSERELRDEINKWNTNRISEQLLQKNINWEFNPPSGSHFGGVWERIIRSVRKVLYSLLQQQCVRLDDEALQTLLCEVEAILNGRPITDIPNQPNDLEALTPNHLLKLHAGESLPPGIFCKTDNYVQRRWRQVQFLADEFWRRWVREYLPSLQERQKWLRSRRNLQTGDIVLIMDNSPRNSWGLGKVLEAMYDSNGLVRIVKLKTKSGVLTRPVDKLCLVLEGSPSDD